MLMIPSNVLILDCNAICHMAKHKMGSLLSYEGRGTGVVYGFLLKLMALAETSMSKVFVFTWDSSNNKGVRRELYPEYKAVKVVDKTEEEIESDKLAYTQFDELRKVVLPHLGFKNIFAADGYEADDLIASVVYSLAEDFGIQVMVASSDHDLLQLLNCCRILSLKDRVVLTGTAFIETWGFGPEYWSTVKAIAGCTSDNVQGIKGVGEKTAAKFLRNELKKTSKKYKDIIENWHIVERNFELVDLPIDGTPEVVVDFSNHFSAQHFLEICEEYGFKSWMNRNTTERWKKVFGQKN